MAAYRIWGGELTGMEMHMNFMTINPTLLLHTLSGSMFILASALMYGFRMRRRERRIKECL